MVLENTTSTTLELLTGLSLSEGHLVLEPLVVFVIGMVIYSVFIYKFYRFISRRDIFKLDKTGSSVVYGLKYVFIFPIIAFVWFFVISVLLSLLSAVLTIGDVFMIAMATLATIRVTAYYHEDLSRDVAKLIPFGLLAVFLLDISSISAATPLLVLSQLSSVASTLVYYFIFIVILEIVMRIATHGRHKKIHKNTDFSQMMH